MAELAAVRERLAARQEHVLGELLAGRVPDGFDPRTTLAAGRQLRTKRRHDVVRVRPVLGDVPGLPVVFDEYARSAPRPGCVHADADAFGAWLEGAELPRETADWVSERRVAHGEQRWALVGSGSRCVLLVALGARTWRIDLGIVRRRRG